MYNLPIMNILVSEAAQKMSRVSWRKLPNGYNLSVRYYRPGLYENRPEAIWTISDVSGSFGLNDKEAENILRQFNITT